MIREIRVEYQEEEFQRLEKAPSLSGVPRTVCIRFEPELIGGIVHSMRTEELVAGRIMADYDDTDGGKLVSIEVLG